MDMELDQGKILSWFNPFLCFSSALAVDCTMHVSVTHKTRNLSFPVTLNSDFFFQIAARNCRKRKGEQILQLEEELEIIRRSKQGIKSMNEDLIKSHADWSARLKTLERKMLDKMLGPGHLSSSLVLKDSKIQLSQSS